MSHVNKTFIPLSALFARIENGLKLRPTTQDIQQETDSDNESDEEGDFEVVYGRTCMTRSGRSVPDHDWCVWIYEDGVMLIVIRLNLICTSINRGHISYRLPILLLRLDNYALFYIFSYLEIVLMAEFM